MKKRITKSDVDALLRGTPIAAHETPKGIKGIYRRDLGPARSFKKIGKTWKEVYEYVSR